MTDQNKFDQFSKDIYNNDDFELEEFKEEKKENWEIKENSDSIELSSNNIIKEVGNNESKEVQEIDKNEDPFALEWWNNDSLEDDFVTVDNKNNNINKKRILIFGWIWFFAVIWIIIILFFLLSWSEKTSLKNNPDSKNFASLNEITEEENIDTNTGENIIQEQKSFENESWSIDSNINVKNNSNDDVINVTEAILSPSAMKVKMNSIWEFDWTEENNNNNVSSVKIKENSLVVPTVSKVNFIPDVQIEVLNTQQTYTTNDLIKLEFNVLLNSKTLSYSVSKKIYKDKDFVIDLSLSPITSDIVSIEENLIKEELTVPINIMTKWSHTVWFKINNYPVKSYTFNIN